MAGDRNGSSRVQELSAPACSGALALRRITALLSSARRADAQGEFVQARDLYLEVLKVQRSISRAPLGSIGKSLRDVVVGVEARLHQLQPILKEVDSTTCSSSRPTTNCSVPSASSKSTLSNGNCARGLASNNGDILHLHQGGSTWSSRPSHGLQGDLSTQSMQASSWDTVGSLECPLSARDGYGGRPTTRDGVRTDAGMRPCTHEGRPGTSDWSRRQLSAGAGEFGGLDGVRPSTRDDLRLQQSLNGTRPSARDRENSRKQVRASGAEVIETPRRPSYESALEHSPHDRRTSPAQRPVTRDGVRPPTRGLAGATERRCQDVTIRQVTGRRKRHTPQQASEVLNLETVSPVGSPSPIPSPETFLGDESVDLLE